MTVPSTPHLAVVVVSYNVCDLLRNCLLSLQRSSRLSADKLSVDVIIVDNASADDSVAMVRDEFPDVFLLALDENIGFTGGNNLALQLLGFDVPAAAPPRLDVQANLSPPDYVLLLNPDAQVVSDALWQMVRFLEASPTVGVCGAHLIYGDGRFQHGAFRFPTLAQVLLDLFPLPHVRGMHRLHDSRVNGRYSAAQWQGRRAFAVDFVLGAALMARADAIHAVGGLDDAYFIYCEEMDWCLRMQASGWSVYALPAATVIHHAGQSSQQVRWPAFERLWRSRFRFFSKYPEHYSATDMQLLRRSVALSMRARAASAQRRFANGEISGLELAEELAAYANVASIATTD